MDIRSQAAEAFREGRKGPRGENEMEVRIRLGCVGTAADVAVAAAYEAGVEEWRSSRTYRVKRWSACRPAAGETLATGLREREARELCEAAWLVGHEVVGICEEEHLVAFRI